MHKLTRHSQIITRNQTNGAAKAMLFATVQSKNNIYFPHIGICSMYYQGNPCNMHHNILANLVSQSVQRNRLLPRKFNTIGVSDGISMGTIGMHYSLPSRELIADSIEAATCSIHYDGLITIPGCDKNIPGALMAMLRVNRPGLMVYSGSTRPGCYQGKPIDVVSAFQSYGEMVAGKISKFDREQIIRHACPGPGSCGGMYTANTMAVICEAMGITLPNSSSNLAISSAKKHECLETGFYLRRLLELNLKPCDIITPMAIRNGIVTGMALGGSTNLVLHMLAIARECQIKLTLTDIQQLAKTTPLIGNFKPFGKYLMSDVYQQGGMSRVLKYLLDIGLIDGNCQTVTGLSLSQNLSQVKPVDLTDKLIYPIDGPLKSDSHIQILTGNLAPLGAVSKITGNQGLRFEGKAMVYDSEMEMVESLDLIREQARHQLIVIVIRYLGPSVGMPEMLKPTSLLAGTDLLERVALITDGRFSGGSHGFIVGHISPEAYKQGPIAYLENGDQIVIDSLNHTIECPNLNLRRSIIERQPLFSSTSYLSKYSRLVSGADLGCITSAN